MANPTEAQRIVLQQAMEIVDYGAAQGSLNSGSKTETPHEGTSGVTDHDLLGGDLFGGDLLGGRSDTAPTGSGTRTLSLHCGHSDTATTGSGKRTLSHHRDGGSSDTATTSSGRRTHDRMLGNRSQITADDLKFRITFSEEGSLLRPSEEQAWVHFGDFLDECEAASGCTGASLSDVKAFCIGAGRNQSVGVGFLRPHDGQARPQKLAIANTCAGFLQLPTFHGENFGSFRDAMIRSLKESDGFGGI